MIVTVLPSKAYGRMEAPPSKSMAHRLLICAGLAEGTSIIQNIDFSEDILATIDCLRALGAEISCGNRSVTVCGAALELSGEAESIAILDCRECGSTLRFMIPLCLMNGKEYLLRGSRTLFTRPLTVYEDICAAQGLTFIKEEGRLMVSGRLSAGEYEIPGNISSQFVSGLLFALPLLDGDSRIHLIPPVESRSYIGMTMQAQELFGVSVVWEDEFTIRIKGGQKYSSQNTRVEGDYSNAAFFEALNLASEGADGGQGSAEDEREGGLSGKDVAEDQCEGGLSGKGAAEGQREGSLQGQVIVEGLREDSLQGDRVYGQYFDRLGEGYAKIDLSDCPDLGPVLIAAAALLHGAEFTGTRRLKIKESDRGLAMRQELRKMGVTVETGENEILVTAGVKRPEEPLDGHNDHRIVMALAVMLTRTGGTIRGAEAVRKSLPDFWDRLAQLGVEVRVEKE